jgi:hypothetical protein
LSRREPEPERAKQSYSDRLREDRDVMLRAAKSWVAGVDDLAKWGKLESCQCAILEGCRTLMQFGTRDDWWLVERAVAKLAESGRPVREDTNASWLKKLRGAGELPVSLGAPIGMDFGAPSSTWGDL